MQQGPVYSKGALCHTLVTSPPDTRRVRTLGEFSEKLNGSTTKELVYPEEVPEGKQDNQFQSWLLSVQTCLKSISQTPQFPARSSSRAGSPTLMEKQQLCKPLKKYLESDASTKAGNFRRILTSINPSIGLFTNQCCNLTFNI